MDFQPLGEGEKEKRSWGEEKTEERRGEVVERELHRHSRKRRGTGRVGIRLGL